MKTIISKNKRLTKVVLLSVATFMHFQAYGTSSTNVMKSLGAFVIKIEQRISQFFNPSNPTPYDDHYRELKAEIDQYTSKLEKVTRAPGDALFTEVLEIAEYARQTFNAVFGVIKQYNGQPSDKAMAFVSDLKRVFNPDVAFSTIIAKLNTVYKKAEAQNNTDLMILIKNLIVTIERKRDDWNNNPNKKPMVLLRGLSTRMNL